MDKPFTKFESWLCDVLVIISIHNILASNMVIFSIAVIMSLGHLGVITRERAEAERKKNMAESPRKD